MRRGDETTAMALIALSLWMSKLVLVWLLAGCKTLGMQEAAFAGRHAGERALAGSPTGGHTTSHDAAPHACERFAASTACAAAQITLRA